MAFIKVFIVALAIASALLSTPARACFGESDFTDWDNDGVCNELDPCPSSFDAADSLSPLSDDFEGMVALSPSWQVFNPAKIAVSTVQNGIFTLEPPAGGSGPTGSFWFNNNEGNLVYQEIQGDFDARALVEVTNSFGDAQPPLSNFRLAGLAAHDPDRTQHNFVHVAVGSGDVAFPVVEWKDTQDDISNWAVAPWMNGVAEINLIREGDLFTFRARPNFGEGPWTVLQVVDRAANPLPNLLQVGFMCYSNVEVHDIALHVHYFSIREPCALAMCEADVDNDNVPNHCDDCWGADDRLDSDGDQTPNCLDECPSNPYKTEETMCGCSYWDSDPDSDGECGWWRPDSFTLRTRNPPAPRPRGV